MFSLTLEVWICLNYSNSNNFQPRRLPKPWTPKCWMSLPSRIGPTLEEITDVVSDFAMLSAQGPESVRSKGHKNWTRLARATLLSWTSRNTNHAICCECISRFYIMYSCCQSVHTYQFETLRPAAIPLSSATICWRPLWQKQAFNARWMFTFNFGREAIPTCELAKPKKCRVRSRIAVQRNDTSPSNVWKRKPFTIEVRFSIMAWELLRVLGGCIFLFCNSSDWIAKQIMVQ